VTGTSSWVRLLLACAGVIVPRSHRQRWREQWDAELAHYDRWLAREGQSAFDRGRRVLARAAGAIPHAATLRLLSWSPRMIEQDV
jgi:hypothetical protein